MTLDALREIYRKVVEIEDLCDRHCDGERFAGLIGKALEDVTEDLRDAERRASEQWAKGRAKEAAA